MKFYIKTFGCQMNVNDSEIMAGLLKNEGFEWTENSSEADIIILNTCAIREKAENKLYGSIGVYGKYKKDKDVILAVCGCSAEKEGKELLKRFPYVNFVFGTKNYVDIVNLVERAKKGKRFIDLSDKLDMINSELPKHTQSKHHAWVTIIHGCNKYCTYCIVPYTRGIERSRPVDDIIKEVQNYAHQGFREITFLGQNVDSYGKDFGDKKPKLDLLIREAAKIDGIERIWFMTSYPTDITDDLIRTVAEEPKAAKYFHLPVQSGSNKVLHEMNRRYTREEFLELINKIKKIVPEVTISTDVIVGFPGETDDDFMDTVDIIKKCGFEKTNIAEYSPREGTIAHKNFEDNIPREVKNRRLNYILNLQKEMNHSENEKYLDKIVDVIQEAPADVSGYYGRTYNNKIVIFPGKQENIGKKVRVLIKRISAGPLYGQIVGE